MSKYLGAGSPPRESISRPSRRPISAPSWLLFASFLCTWLLGALPFSLADISSPQFITGHLLAATPEMPDPRFAQALIYIVDHSDQGAMGVIINRPMARGPIKDLLQSFGLESPGAEGEIIIYSGGPLAVSSGFVLHTDDVLLERSRAVKDGIALTADVELVEAMAYGRGPRQSLVILGYTGWAPGQLEKELEGGSWTVVRADRDLIFDREASGKKWRKAMDRRRISL